MKHRYDLDVESINSDADGSVCKSRGETMSVPADYLHVLHFIVVLRKFNLPHVQGRAVFELIGIEIQTLILYFNYYLKYSLYLIF